MDTKLLTYAELGAALGITAASAKRLAIRRAWAKKPGNDGKARVAVPVERLEGEHAVSGDAAGEVTKDAAGDAAGDVTGDMSAAVTALTRHVERLERDLAAASVERDAERARAAQVDVLRAILEAEQRRATELREERDRWQAAAMAPRGLMAWLRRAG